MNLSTRINNCQASQTIALDTLAKEMIARGEKVINLTAGQPDFDTFKEIKNFISKAVNEKGINKYSAPAGLPALKQAIIKEIKSDYKINYKPEEIVVTNGAKQALYNLFQVLLNAGDEVIVPIPGWVSYGEQIKLASGKPVFVKTKPDFQLDLEAINKKITKKTKLIILNSPNNPTSAVYKKADLQKLNKIIKTKNIFVVSDDPYRYILFNQKFCSFSQVNKNKTIIVDSVSKSHAMPGYRVGWVAVANKEIIKAMAKLQSQCSGNVCNLAQTAAIKALSLSKSKSSPWFLEYKKRRNYLIKELSKINKISFTEPQGAFYFFINIKKIESDSVKFCKKLLKQEKVVLVPGKYFNQDGYARLSFAYNLKDLKEAVKRLNRFINKY